MNISNLRLRTRLFAGFGILCAFLLLIVVFGTVMLGRINAGTEVIVTNYMPKIEASNAVLSDVNVISLALRNMLLNPDAADRKEQAASIDKARSAIDATYARLQAVIVSEQGKALLKQSRDYNAQAIAAQDELLRRIGAGDTAGASDYLVQQYRPLLGEYRKAIAGQIQMQKDLAAKAVAEARQTYDSTVNMMIGLSTVIFVLAAFIA